MTTAKQALQHAPEWYKTWHTWAIVNYKVRHLESIDLSILIEFVAVLVCDSLREPQCIAKEPQIGLISTPGYQRIRQIDRIGPT